MEVNVWIKAFLALFAILNPIGNIPIYSEFVDGLDRRTRIKVFNVAVLTGFVTMVSMTFTGKWIMNQVFQIDILEFRLAGGLLLTIIAIRYIVFPPKEPKASGAGEDRVNRAMELSVVPMAVPLLVGPGAIVTGILLLDQHGPVISITTLVSVFLVCWILFQISPIISRMMGKIGRLVVGRVLWIFIAAMGVNLLISSIKEIFIIR
jgi:multiple antibiotic resistance protein